MNIEQNIRRLGVQPSDRAAAPIDWGALLGRGAGLNPQTKRAGSISGFPASGRQPVASSGFLMDFRDNSIVGPSLAKTQIISSFSLGADIQGLFNSMFVIADNDIAVELYPGYQGFQLDSCAFYSIPIQGLGWFKTRASQGFVFQTIFSSQDDPLAAFPITFHQERWASQTLTKTNGVGVADSWTTIAFAPSDGSTQLDPATYGDGAIHTGSIGAKNFLTTAADNDINLLIEGLNVAGKTWVADPTTGSSGITLADGDASNAQTARYYHVIRMRARVDAAVAAAGTAAITVQYRGFAAGL